MTIKTRVEWLPYKLDGKQCNPDLSKSVKKKRERERSWNDDDVDFCVFRFYPDLENDENIYISMWQQHIPTSFSHSHTHTKQKKKENLKKK
jgi:hypothetical protein